MCDLLGPVEGLRVLEPSVGQGAFLAGLHGSPKSIDAVDVDPLAIEATRAKFSRLPLNLHCCNFMDAFLSDIFSDRMNIAKQSFDAVISNPPYGLYLQRDYRAKLKLACTRFRRHQVRCFNGTGGASWSDGSLRGSSSLRPYG
jgi:predicted RNA methylase